jgi:arylformamidase
MTDSGPRRMIDLSHPLSADTPAFPGDPSPRIEVFDSTDVPSKAGERHMNCSRLDMSLHCGTHMDAPFHFMADGVTIDRVPLEHCVGATLLIRLPYESAGLTIDVEHLVEHEAKLRSTRRVVFNTHWHHRWRAENYFTEHPIITGAAAQWMIDRGVVLIGVDTPSVDRAPYDAHLAILGSGALIVENLTNLDAITAEVFQLIATPLAIHGRDGSPVRAIAVV